ncbi:hypothetical protein [Rheinheimera sp. MMS21-TC3]|uniref:hypothetical protein n=1 Tax=Rheinheimera sp. MMS21-TC3 TaxID=3072790 RepID=UPI0028C48E3C|nr:hypothetical protein [Rheinheimera sp. MMS21-TC3]WNO59453.1 hypothetical protein RDV63_00355 [Rheinheimera sp. MMS21-TC3]
MKSISLKSDILIMILVMPLSFFISTGLISDSKELSFNYFLTCFVSVTLGILLGAGFSNYFLSRIRKIKFFPFFAWLISLAVGMVLGFITLAFVETHISIIGSTEIMMGFVIVSWIQSLKSPANSNHKSA